jgi:hypothetical protein
VSCYKIPKKLLTFGRAQLYFVVSCGPETVSLSRPPISDTLFSGKNEKNMPNLAKSKLTLTRVGQLAMSKLALCTSS